MYDERTLRMDCKLLNTDSDNLLRENIVKHEWKQFQAVDNEGGPASCQSNWPVFHHMRYSQFSVWPSKLLISYAHDLKQADQEGRNLLTEKYARMMESTSPDEYRLHIAPYMPKLGIERQTIQESIISQQVAWAKSFRAKYPRLGKNMRLLHTVEDTEENTSFETYLRGELSTYSIQTLGLYQKMILSMSQEGRNLTEETILTTVKLAGFTSLQEAEKAEEVAADSLR